MRKDQPSNADTADLADTVERLSLLTKTLEIRTGRYPHGPLQKYTRTSLTEY